MYFPKRGGVETLNLVSEMLARNGKCFSERNRRCAKMEVMTVVATRSVKPFPRPRGKVCWMVGTGFPSSRRVC